MSSLASSSAISLALPASLFLATALVLFRTTISRSDSNRSRDRQGRYSPTKKSVSFSDDVEIRHLPDISDYEPVCTSVEALQRLTELRQMIDAALSRQKQEQELF